jgi:hypothetical protein
MWKDIWAYGFGFDGLANACLCQVFFAVIEKREGTDTKRDDDRCSNKPEGDQMDKRTRPSQFVASGGHHLVPPMLGRRMSNGTAGRRRRTLRNFFPEACTFFGR